MYTKYREAEGLFQDTNWEDLYIGETNFGFELPGTYDISVEISSFGLMVSRNLERLPKQNIQ